MPASPLRLGDHGLVDDPHGVHIPCGLCEVACAGNEREWLLRPSGNYRIPRLIWHLTSWSSRHNARELYHTRTGVPRHCSLGDHGLHYGNEQT